MRKLKFSFVMCCVLFFGAAGTCQPAPFHIDIQRQRVRGALVIGTISVNDQVIGNTYENLDLMINAGSYPGLLRYWSKKNFVQGPFGTIGNVGDFLLEVANVNKRTDILLHGGNKPEHSLGCILLGAVGKDPQTGIPSLTPDHPLVKLRVLFYGTDVPNATPDKQITIDIHDIPMVLVGTWRGNVQFSIGGQNIVLKIAATFTATNNIYSGSLTFFNNTNPPTTSQAALQNISVDGQNTSFDLAKGGTIKGLLSPDNGHLHGTMTDAGGRTGSIALDKSP